MVKEFVLYSQNKLLIKSQKENAFNIAKKNYAKDVATLNYNSVFKKIFTNVKKQNL